MGKRARTKKCPLCKVKRKLWKGKEFFGIKDRVTGRDLIISCYHQKELSERAQEALPGTMRAQYDFPYRLIRLKEYPEHWAAMVRPS
jgi:hypothetical protein